jgi:hypothetical protein
MAAEPQRPQLSADAGNAQFRWDDFAAQEYSEHNYGALRADDAEILGIVNAWFAKELAGREGTRIGLDAGAGPNLYPALAMLPYCRSVTLRDYSSANVTWLKEQVVDLPGQWAQYWDLVSPEGALGGFDEARALLALRARVEQGNVFELPPRLWDLGTMFFVAESISPRFEEFAEANHRFLGSLAPGAPFAAAYMENSDGYTVAGTRFPAIAVGVDEVRACLDKAAVEVRVHRVAMDPAPLRAGYTGMLIATGRIAGQVPDEDADDSALADTLSLSFDSASVNVGLTTTSLINTASNSTANGGDSSG